IDYGTVPRARLDPKALASHLLAPGDVLITRSGTCGIAAVFKEGAIPMVAGAFLIRLRIKASLDPHYLREFFNNTVGKALTEKLLRVESKATSEDPEYCKTACPSLHDKNSRRWFIPAESFRR